MLVTNSNLLPPLQTYINALLKKGGIFAGHFETQKCKTCFEKALTIDANCTDVFIHRARVSLIKLIISFLLSFLFYLSFFLSLPCSLLSSTSLSLLYLLPPPPPPPPPFSSTLTPPPALPFPSSPPPLLSRSHTGWPRIRGPSGAQCCFRRPSESCQNGPQLPLRQLQPCVYLSPYCWSTTVCADTGIG